MKTTAEVVIIGAGAAGASVAFNLAKRGVKDIVVVEKRFTPWGGTGRCGAGIREQWGSEASCWCGSYSLDQYEHLNEETGYDHDIGFIHDGYLMTIHTQKDYDLLVGNMEFQHTQGIKSVFLTPEECKELVPYMTIDDGLMGACFNQRDGHANPFHVTHSWKYGAERLGVTFYNYTEVVAIETEGDRISAVVTDKGKISTHHVVNAGGAYAKFISHMLHLPLPFELEKHEILITEPFEYDKKVPMIHSRYYNTYISHLQDGGFLMGWGDINAHTGEDASVEHTWQFLDIMAKNCIIQCPPLAKVRVIRQWAGHYGLAEDNQVIIGPDPDVEGYHYALGSSFMFGPAMGTLVSEMLLGETPSYDKAYELTIGRFKAGKLLYDKAYV